MEIVAAMRLMPLAGSHVLINEAHHASGKLTYDVMRLTD